MGRNNRQRRAAKARERRKSTGSHSGRSGPRGSAWAPFTPPAEDPWFTPGDRFVIAVRAHQTGDDDAVGRLVEQLAQAPRRSTAGVIATYLEDQVAFLWRHGWQPVDLDRIVCRELARAEVGLLRAVLAAQAATYEVLGARVAPDWMEQLARIGAVPRSDQTHPYLIDQADEWPGELLAAVRAMALLTRLPGLPLLMDPPERWVDGPLASCSALPATVLDKVRALLAKAESSTFARTAPGTGGRCAKTRREAAPSGRLSLADAV